MKYLAPHIINEGANTLESVITNSDIYDDEAGSDGNSSLCLMLIDLCDSGGSVVKHSHCEWEILGSILDGVMQKTIVCWRHKNMSVRLTI